MQKRFRKVLFIFRRDLRLYDNTGLIYALEQAKEVIAAFIFTPQQIEQNAYRSDHCLQFMLESLQDLQRQLGEKGKLHLFYGAEQKVVAECIKQLDVDGVIVNRDYTPYSVARDRKLSELCGSRGVAFHAFDDVLLNAPEKMLKNDGRPYVVFTPYYKRASTITVAQPVPNPYSNYYKEAISFAQGDDLYQKILPKRSPQSHGGRNAALRILKEIGNYALYDIARDYPAQPGTTHLSSHLKFTTCSPREIYWAIKEGMPQPAPLLRSLYWRDFFSCIAFYFPDVFEGAFHHKYNAIQWNDDESSFKRWCAGQTGVPIVDAGMREMNQTGFMHNRVRMIAASFLVKDLHIDWKRGERYFAQQLIDYDPAVNNGNWQWCASTGCDAQPYFRIFNPWLQSLKFDPEAIYIKQWVPELSAAPAKVIHNWHTGTGHAAYPSYPRPMVEHSAAAAKALALYRQC